MVDIYSELDYKSMSKYHAHVWTSSCTLIRKCRYLIKCMPIARLEDTIKLKKVHDTRPSRSICFRENAPTNDYRWFHGHRRPDHNH